MSATADKARYFLEQSVPELKEYEKKGIFAPYEITSISRKRSDFEHKINARGSKPGDYAQYAEFEINVDALRRKRVKRLGIKSTTHNGQRRVFFVFDRGTRKFPGDVDLWMQSIQYAQRQKAYKKLAQVFTSVLRLHPAKPQLWIYAAQVALEENGDMTEARSYMQRGLRFCKSSRAIWLEYIRLELAYIAKIHARRQILGLSKISKDTKLEEQDENTGKLLLPKLTAEDIAPDVNQTHDIDQVALQNLDNTPAMSGAIPIAIFDAAMNNFNHDPAFGRLVFEMAADMDGMPVTLIILQHIIEALEKKTPQSWHTHICLVTITMFGQHPGTAAWVMAIRKALNILDKAIKVEDGRADFADWCRTWLQDLLVQDMDDAIKVVLRSKLRSLEQF